MEALLRTAFENIATAMLDETAPYSLPVSGPARVLAGLTRIARATPWAICVITAVAAALRFAQIEGVSANQFYDAAVRSMTLSWHNFLYGAFDPAGILSIDKPPLDLWLQVASVKLLGWNSFALKLPEALGGTLAVPLLYDAVRRAVGRPAGLAAAAALAVLPESVLTSRSDTMDSVMMLLVIAALWLTIRASTMPSRPAIVLAGVTLGLAFNVKLLEAFVAAPALVVLYVFAAEGSLRRKLFNLIQAGVAMVSVGLSWAIAVSTAPGAHPWPVGSTDGTVWNAMFVFNGFGKISGATVTKTGGPGPLRLVVVTDWHYDVLFGCVLIAALAIGVAALVHVWARGAWSGGSALRAVWPWSGGSAQRAAWRRASLPRGLWPRGTLRPPLGIERAFALCLAVWIGVAVIVFDTMGTVHARYLEALSPALAAAIGYGAATLAGLRGTRGPSVIASALALAGIGAYTLHFKPTSLGWGAGALVIAAVGAALVTKGSGRLGQGARWLTAGLIVSCALIFPVHESLSLVRSNANDSLGLATAPAGNAVALSRYLGNRTNGVRYELAADEPLALAPLIIHDQRPLLPLTSFGGLPLTSVSELQSAVRNGSVRYGLVDAHRCPSLTGRVAACAPAALWIRAHGVDVTPSVGLVGRARLYLLSRASAG